MQELIKYFEALEARLAAQEEQMVELDKRFADINTRLAEITQRLAEMVQVEPEVEVDLVYPEDEEVTVELPQESEDSIESTDSSENTDSIETPAEPEPVAEPIVEQEPVAEPEPEPEVVEQVEQPAPEPVVEPQPEAPRMPLQTSLFGTPVTDIRQAVSIGDRFLFQRELFAGNAEKLQKTLTELNNLHSLDEAIAFIDKFGWDKQSPTYELFLNVLRRRFQ